MIGRISIIILLSTFTFSSVNAQSIDLSGLNADVETGVEAGTGLTIEPLEGVSNKCEEYVEDKGYQLGQNTKRNGSKFYIGVGDSAILAPTGSPNYITSRQNAYEQALLFAKSAILEEMKSTVSRNVKLSIAQGKFVEDDKLKNEIKEEVGKNAVVDNRDESSAYNKAMELLNRKLDKELDKTAPMPVPKTLEEAEEQAEEVVDTALGQSFSDFIESVSASNLYGIRRFYVFESAPPGKQGQICVATLHSANTQAIANAIFAQDASLFPAGSPNPDYKTVIPNPKTQEGMFELLSTFGIDMTRDENGNFILISYAQSGVRGKGPVAFKLAKENAKIRAEGNIASFIAEAAASKKKMKETESYEQAADGAEYYKGDGAFKKDIESETKNVVISGMRQGRSWGIKHPVTKQGIVGTWVTISSESMSSNIALEKKMNASRPSKGSGGSGKSSKSKSSKVDYGKVKKGYSGGSRKQNNEDDF
jgi:hypothetical protein